MFAIGRTSLRVKTGTQATATLTTKTIVRNAATGCRETRSRSDELRPARRALSANRVMIFPHRVVELGGVVEPAAMTRRKPSHSHEAVSRFSREECPSTTGATAGSKRTFGGRPRLRLSVSGGPVIISPPSTDCALHSALTATPKPKPSGLLSVSSVRSTVGRFCT
jgi:hypothetical protein